MNIGPPPPPRPAAAGRPATIDPDAVARIALGLFAERGYEATSMEDIAGAAGIGRKSLYRYFASKADLVWDGIGPAAEAAGLALDTALDEALNQALDEAADGGAPRGGTGSQPPGAGSGGARPTSPDAAQIRAGLGAAAAAGAAALPDLTLTRGRLRLIAEHPDLASRSYAALAPQRERGLQYLIALGVRTDTAGYLCAAYLGATFEAWMQWAAGNDPDPVPHLLAAVDVLRIPEA